MAEQTLSAPRPLSLAPARRASVLGLLWRSRLSAAGLGILALFFLIAALAPWVARQNPTAQNLALRLHPPTLAHPMGVDQLGRDVFSRVVYGARLSLVVGLMVVSIAGSLGTVVGLISGYAGGILDEVLMRVTEVFLAFPALILAMAVAGALGPSLTNAVIAIIVATWPIYARLARGQALAIQQREYVEAARTVGATHARILWYHVFPNAVAPLLVQASFDMGNAILSVAGLSFIGFGAQPPTPEWGVMISDARNFISTHPWLPTFPGLAILLTVMGFNLLGDGLRDVLDPRLRGQG